MASPLHKKQITKYLKSHKTSINKDGINDRSQTSAKSNKTSVQIPKSLEDKNRAAQGPRHYVAQSSVPKHNASQSPGPKRNASEPPGPKQNALKSPGTKHNASQSPGPKHNAAYTKRTKQFPAVNTTKNSIKSLNNLPDEILLQIFQYLGPTDLLLACTISKRWLALTADNVLWLPIYERYVANNKKTGSNNGDKCVNASTQFKEPGYWKHQCMQRCGQSRSKKAVAMLKKLSPYTGLPKLTTQALESLGTKWILLLKDSTGVEHTMWHSDAFHHQMSLSVRWYGLEWPPLSRITQLSLYAANPIFSSSDKSKQGPCRRSLLLSCKFTWNKWLESLKPIGGDNMCHFYLLADALLIAVFKNDGGIAFISSCLHHHMLIPRCIEASAIRSYMLPPHKPIPDDVDMEYGLHDYSLILELRNLRQSLLSVKQTRLHCKPEEISGACAVFDVIHPDVQYEHIVLDKKIQFLWKTDLFKGAALSMCILDCVVLDERGEVFWTVSSPVEVKQPKVTDVSYDYTGDVQTIDYADSGGTLHLSITGLPDEEKNIVTHVQLRIPTTAINHWFATRY